MKETSMKRSSRLKQGSECRVDQDKFPIANEIRDCKQHSETLSIEMSETNINILNWGREVSQRITAAIPGKSAIWL